MESCWHSTIHKRNANSNHNEIPLHFYQSRKILKHYKHQPSTRLWNKESYILLLGIKSVHLHGTTVWHHPIKVILSSHICTRQAIQKFHQERRKWKTKSATRKHKWFFPVALFTTATNYKQPKCSSISKWDKLRVDAMLHSN